MLYQIEVRNKANFKDHHAGHVKHDIEGLGLKHKVNVKYDTLYRLTGDLNLREISTIVKDLLIDPVTQESTILCVQEDLKEEIQTKKKHGKIEVEVWFKHGVTDTVSDSVVKAIKDLGIEKEVTAKTGHKYILEGNITEESAVQIAEKLLANAMVQRYTVKA